MGFGRWMCRRCMGGGSAVSLREIGEKFKKFFQDYLYHIQEINVLDWPLSYIFIAGVIILFAILAGTAIVAYFWLLSLEYFEKSRLKLMLIFFERYLGVAFGGFLFFAVIVTVVIGIIIFARRLIGS